MAGFNELILGGVFIAPFVTYALAAVAVLAILYPVMRLLHVDAIFANPPLALLCLYVIVIAALITLFAR